MKIYLAENAFFKPFGNSSLDQITHMMNQVEIERCSSREMWQAGDNLRLPGPDRRGILLLNLEKADTYKVNEMGMFTIKPSVVGGEKVDEIMNTLPLINTKKREFSPTDTTQMGSLPKHPTKIKKNDDLRVKFFDGRKPDSADGSPVLRQREKRIKRTPGRRKSTISGQTLITSIFSPRTDS